MELTGIYCENNTKYIYTQYVDKIQSCVVLQQMDHVAAGGIQALIIGL
jgi:hypothetical protein